MYKTLADHPQAVGEVARKFETIVVSFSENIQATARIPRVNSVISAMYIAVASVCEVIRGGYCFAANQPSRGWDRPSRRSMKIQIILT